MESLFSHNAPPTAGQQVLPTGPSPIPPLPPQMFTTAASLLDLTDSEIPPTIRTVRPINEFAIDSWKADRRNHVACNQ